MSSISIWPRWGSLRSSVPEVIRKRIGISRNLLVYGAFCYEFVSVSVLWCLTCVEMALWEKFTEMNPGPLTLEDRKGNRQTFMAKQLAAGIPEMGALNSKDDAHG
jgi:hypothetical protein